MPVFLPLLFALQSDPAARLPCGPCCPTALVGFRGVGFPPAYPAAIFLPGPKPSKLGRPHPEGLAILEIGINDTGHVVSACVLRGLRPDADRAAQEAVLQWRFTPTHLNGRPMGVIFTVTVRFPPRPHWTLPPIVARPLVATRHGSVTYVDPEAPCPASRNEPPSVGPDLDPPLLDYVMPEVPLAVDLLGTAIVEVVIETDGRVSRARALRGDWPLTDPMITAAYAWRFARTCIGGRPVPVIKAVTLRRIR
jgi:TonB family protein